jgi:arabinofuranosyltransferase
LGALLTLASLGLLWGWRVFWFLTDDAHIAFRYIGNSVAGHGYVWNPPPFLPVEGYTSFLWVVLLDATWRFFGVEPPNAANNLSLVFSYLTLLVVVAMMLQLRLRPELARWRVPALGLVLLGCLSNRTFLAWTSSGLETALFNFLFVCWVYGLGFGRGRKWVLVCTVAALTYLARPDGLLHVAATLALSIYHIARAPSQRIRSRSILECTPLLLVPLHLVWRRSFYGEWLPNTYTAKYLGPWPESGIRYLASFILEYALWVWLIVLVAAFVYQRRNSLSPVFSRLVFKEPHLPAALSVVFAHFAYYTFLVGGDHFEYRVYSHLVPLSLISFVALVNTLPLRPRAATALFGFFLAASLAIPWTHWQLTRGLTLRSETFRLEVPVAPSFPAPIRWYARAFDSLQFWLIDRNVCMRHQEHKVFCDDLRENLPARHEGARFGDSHFPVMAASQVGVLGWAFPNLNIIDELGLNDYVVARSTTPPNHGEETRQMAHERTPPPGYVASYRPNFGFWLDPPRIIPREEVFTAETIAGLERAWRARIANGEITERPID